MIDGQARLPVNLLHDVLDRAGLGMASVGRDGVLLTTNREAEEILGGPCAGRMLTDVVLEKDRGRLEEAIRTLRQGGRSVVELEVECPGPGDTRHLTLILVPPQPGGPLECAIVDRTWRLHHERCLRKLEERAIVAGFSRHLSHVLINATLSLGSHLKQVERRTRDCPEASAATSQAWRDLERVEEVVRGYQDYVALMGIVPREVSPFGLAVADFVASLGEEGDTAVRRIVASVQGRLQLVTRDNASKHVAVALDPSFFNKGLAYLLRGAVHNALARGGAEPVELHLTTWNDHRWAMLELATPGIVTPPDAMASLYSPWLHQMLVQTFDDWGVTIANGMTEQLRGSLTVESVRDTLFRVRLPAIFS